MILRIHSIYNRSKKILAVMMALMVIDFGLQLGAGHWVNSVLLITQNPRIVTCFNQPSSYAYIIVFLSPTVFHHAILLLTLWKSITTLRKAKEVGVQSILGIIQRDHIAYVLVSHSVLICFVPNTECNLPTDHLPHQFRQRHPRCAEVALAIPPHKPATCRSLHTTLLISNRVQPEIRAVEP